MVMTVHCPSCQTEFPVDPAKVPVDGVLARCSECPKVFRVERLLEEAVAPSVGDEFAPGEPEPEAVGAGRPDFGRRNPKDRAARLARVLVSDIVLYNSARHEKSMEQGTLREEFQDEINKSWNEWVEQVGHEIAESTDYWAAALNQILAKGEKLF